ncbi:OmpH family outer membrane protein [Aestuariirhabdus litorea]|uniref:OmpH family outer membrane protein n=1 Tax=Aestuariirhabdus litorea TaxID=2528527 RepID=A0A3P3VQM8_9GAMM|nr:OmpH family outer membrane protein [Aestuariirhabdus litorea]RRJ85101.1 OmpH family outer membrane protein [Aestuariirhabdus litorea]RWW98327.1 OmpH family outer membrane protein [Endozoicomonadaceae bacterium GTF-13]
MNRCVQLVVLALGLATGLAAQADTKIAVVNYQMALIESDAAKAYAKRAEDRFGAQVNELKKLEEEGKRLQAKYERDAAAMSESEKKELEMELQRKAQDFEYKSKQLQSEKAQSDRSEIEALRPKLDQAIQAVVKEGGYDLVLERNGVVFVSPAIDITTQVIQKLNKGS